MTLDTTVDNGNPWTTRLADAAKTAKPGDTIVVDSPAKAALVANALQRIQPGVRVVDEFSVPDYA